MPIRLQNIDLADGAASGLGIVLQYTWFGPAGTVVDSVKASTQLAAAASPTAATAVQSFTSGITAPDWARNISIVFTDTTPTMTASTCRIYGTRLCDGAMIYEDTAFTVTATKNTAKAFNTVSSVWWTLNTGSIVGSGDEVFSLGTIGTVDVATYGLPYKIDSSTDIIRFMKFDPDEAATAWAPAAEAIHALSLSEFTICPGTTASDGDNCFSIVCRSNYGLPTGLKR